MRKYLISVSAVIALCLTAPAAFANNHPQIDKCNVKVSGNTINVDGSAKNLDKHKAALVLLIIKGTITGDCVNPGGNKPPGQSNKKVAFEETRKDQFGSGNKKINFKFKVTPFVSAGDVCPNPNWSFDIKKIQLNSVVVKLLQGNNVVTEHCL